MLKQRVATASFLLALLLVVLFLLPRQGFVVAVTAVFALAAWEWCNLTGFAQQWQRVAYAVFFAVLLFVLSQANVSEAHWVQPALGLTAAGWGLALVALWRYPQHVEWHQQVVMLLMGLWLLLPPAFGLMVLHEGARGSWLILLVIAVIAVSDIGAYLCGRRFGKRKLAVHVSPGKTWEGFWGGMAASSVFALLAACVLHLSLSAFVLFVLAQVLTAAVSVLGDLFESMIKRERGVKDSSQLLPGHGGVLDRIDGWTAAVPFFTLCYLVSGRFL